MDRESDGCDNVLQEGTLRDLRLDRTTLPKTLEEAIRVARGLLGACQQSLGRYYWFLYDLEKSDLWQASAPGKGSFKEWVRAANLKWGNYGRYRDRLERFGKDVVETFTSQVLTEVETKVPLEHQEEVLNRASAQQASSKERVTCADIRRIDREVSREAENSGSPRVTLPVSRRHGTRGHEAKSLVEDLLKQVPESLKPLVRDVRKAVSRLERSYYDARRDRDMAKNEVKRLRERLASANSSGTSRRSSNLRYSGRNGSAEASCPPAE